MTAYKGHTGSVLVDSDAIVIVRDTLASKASHGGVAPWRIPLQSITSIRLEPATRLKNGKIQIMVGTAPPSDADSSGSDTVLFTRAQREEFGQLADWLREIAKVNAESGIDSSDVPMDPPPTSRGVGGRIKAGQQRAQARADAALARVDAVRVTTQADLDARGVLFEGRSHDDGRNAMVTLYANRIERIKERSMVSLSSAKQDVEVTPLRAVASVQAKKDNMLWTRVTVYASGNNIDFRFGHDEAHRFRDVVTELILNQGQTPPVTPSPMSTPPDAMDQLKKLGELRDGGILTLEEFEAKKVEILKRL
jgi:hypothetical protein